MTGQTRVHTLDRRLVVSVFVVVGIRLYDDSFRRRLAYSLCLPSVELDLLRLLFDYFMST